MKKEYIQPQAINVRLEGGIIMDQLEAGSYAPQGVVSAPGRTYSPAPSLENL